MKQQDGENPIAGPRKTGPDAASGQAPVDADGTKTPDKTLRDKKVPLL